jgi:hypothetical protein
MTYTDEQVEQWFKNNLDASEVEIVRAMQVSGVDPAQVSRVTGADPGYVASRFEAFTTAGPPSPAVSPVVANSISLTPEGTASLGQPTNVSSPANVFSPADYGPPSKNVYDFNRLIRDNEFGKAGELATGLGFAPEDIQSYLNDTNVFPEFGGNVELDTVQSFVPPPPAPDPQPYVDTVAQNLLGRFDQEMDAAMASGDYANVANVMKEAEGLYGPATYTTVADYLNTNPRYEGLRGQVGGAAYTPENLQSFVSSIPAPVDPGIAGALPGGPGDTGAGAGAGAVPTGPAGALPAGPAGSVPAGPAGPGSAAASPSRVYQPTYTSYRQEGQAPFGGYYAQPGIGPYGGVFGVGTEQFEQQSDPFSGAQARAQEMIRNRISPSTVPLNFDASQVDPVGAFNLSMAEGRFEDAAQIAQRAGYSPDIVSEYVSSNRSGLNLPSDFSMTEQDFASLYSTTGFPRQPAAFGGSMSSMGTPSNPFIYRQSLSPLPLPVPEAVSVAETVPASEGSATMRRGGYINQGITAVRR